MVIDIPAWRQAVEANDSFPPYAMGWMLDEIARLEAERDALRKVVDAAREYVQSLREEHEAMLRYTATDAYLNRRLTALDDLADAIDALDGESIA